METVISCIEVPLLGSIFTKKFIELNCLRELCEKLIDKNIAQGEKLIQISYKVDIVGRIVEENNMEEKDGTMTALYEETCLHKGMRIADIGMEDQESCRNLDLTH